MKRARNPMFAATLALAALAGPASHAASFAKKPVDVEPHRPKPNGTFGLREQILAADSENQINLLLGRGRGYRDASAKTRRRWHCAATRRISQLRAQEKLARE